MIELNVFIEENKPRLIESDRRAIQDFYKEHNNSWVRMRLINPKDTRSYQMNKKYWAMLQYFVPDHFDSTDDAHDFFTEKYLTKIDILDAVEGIDTIMDNIKKKARKIKSIKAIGENIEIIWIRSTASLNKKEFSELIEYVERQGNEIGINFGY